MPVPVPRHSKQVAHPVVKKTNCGDSQTIPFQNLTRTLPISPTGPPPSFGTREQWINSLPSWRRTKPRRIWEDDTRLSDQRIEQDFYRGLTAAGNASVIKGAHAEACIPPLYTLLQAPGQLPIETASGLLGSDGNAHDEMSSDFSTMNRGHHKSESQWSATSLVENDDCEMIVEDQSHIQGIGSRGLILIDRACDEETYERGAFTPIFEEESPGTASVQDVGSSPLGPLTPFGEFVDRAVTTAQPYIDGDGAFSNMVIQEHVHQDTICGPQCCPLELSHQPTISQSREAAPPAPEIVTPSATAGYRKLAEPLSEWVANYVWKVCTTGHSLPSFFSRSPNSAVNIYAAAPPIYLASSIHSLLLSTLLQPSAVFLAIWYIVRLPVYFSAAPMGPEFVKEDRFRVALLGDSYSGLEREVNEASAPFRLIVLGCMLANKWLDDHTFSNKTWHNISNVPIQALNRLESLALDIFTYDLTVPSRDWSKWLTHVMAYHMSLSSLVHPQPISRPSSNPHSIVRKSLDEIIQASVAYPHSPFPQPVFLGLAERKKEKLEKEQAMAAEVLEIDLDEDGPLREEYLPRRRVSGAGTLKNLHTQQTHIAARVATDHGQSWDHRSMQEMRKPLPPPAKWSPEGDEPLYRERDRMSGQYVAVQPPLMPTHNLVPYPAPYFPHQEIPFTHLNWMPQGYVAHKSQAAYGFELHPFGQPVFNSYPCVPQVALSHSRSQSLCFDQDAPQARSHMRSHSQSQFEYRCSDLRMTANEAMPPGEVEGQWAASGYYSYPTSNLACMPTYHSAWLRA